MIEYNFYSVDSDRAWDWGNHVFSLGYVCYGHGGDPKEAWREAVRAGRVPLGFEEGTVVAVVASSEQEIEI